MNKLVVKLLDNEFNKNTTPPARLTFDKWYNVVSEKTDFSDEFYELINDKGCKECYYKNRFEVANYSKKFQNIINDKETL